MVGSGLVDVGLNDTDSETDQILFDLYRKMTPRQKAEKIVLFWQAARALAETEVRLRRPELSDREVQLMAASRTIPRELMIKAFRWDPLKHGY